MSFGPVWTRGFARPDSRTGATNYHTGTDMVSHGVVVAANVVQAG